MLKYTGDSISMEFIEPKVPTQFNDYDCGLFALQYIENIIRNPKIVTDGAFSENMVKPLSVFKLSREKLRDLMLKANPDCSKE